MFSKRINGLWGFVMLFFISQQTFAQVNNPINTSCAAALKICESHTHTFNFGLQNDANCGMVSLYYLIHFAGNTPGLLTTMPSGNGTFEYYGPFATESLVNCDALYAYSNQLLSGVFGQTTAAINTPSAGFYLLKFTPSSCSGTLNIALLTGARVICEEEINCKACMPSFSPSPGKYIVSAWVKEEQAALGTQTYTHASISVSFSNSSQVYQLQPSGAIIDGWQRIEGEIEVPTAATSLHIQLKSTSVAVYFDDVRFFPSDGSMMSYVYDPVTLRLMAELDERNYATLYEYDEEGKLIRVKKETERGIMTIQENRDNIRKQ